MTNCLALLMMAGMKFSFVPLQEELRQVWLPDPVGTRYKTMNKFGYSDRTLNAFQERYVVHATKIQREWDRTKDLPENKFIRYQPPFALEIASAYGFMGAELLKNGVHYLYNDMYEDHFLAAEQGVFSEIETKPSQYQEVIGEFPGPENKTLIEIKNQKKRILSASAFHVFHFLSPEKIRKFLDAVWDLLPEDGEFWGTAITPYNGWFTTADRDFPRIGYPYRQQMFERDVAFPGLRLRDLVFPGELFNPFQMGFVTPDYPPDYFHAISRTVFALLATCNSEKPWEVVEVSNIQRPNPESQAFREGYPDRTELIGWILKKKPKVITAP